MTENIPALEVFAVNWDNPHAVSAVQKMAQHGRNGAVVPLTAEEFESLKTDCVKLVINNVEKN